MAARFVVRTLPLLALFAGAAMAGAAAGVAFQFDVQPAPPFDPMHPDPVLAWVALGNRQSPEALAMAQAAGLQKLFDPARHTRDVRLADFNGDGLPDIVSNTYTCNGVEAARALLFINNGDGTFTEDPSFSALQNLRGFGETIVVADFDNDGALDIFLPYYVHPDGDKCAAYGGGTATTPPQPPSFLPQSRLLHNNGPFSVNDGRQHFTDVSERAGLTLMPDYSSGYAAGAAAALPPPEGVQAADVNDDGYVDLYAGSHLFINNGDGTFMDRAGQQGLPVMPDEGAKFIDWNGDGHLDLVVMDVSAEYTRVRLFEGREGGFTEKTNTDAGHPMFSTGGPDYEPLYNCGTFGVTTADLDGDGFEDIVLSGSFYAWSDCGSGTPVRIMRNTGIGFEAAPSSGLDGILGPALMTVTDIDHDGIPDILMQAYQGGAGVNIAAMGRTRPAGAVLEIDVRGPAGQVNQHGRPIRVRPQDGSGRTLMRVVDGGSGYLAQGEYLVTIPTPYAGTHAVSVVFPPLTPGGEPVTVAFDMLPGQRASVTQPSPAVPAGSWDLTTAPAVVSVASPGTGAAPLTSAPPLSVAGGGGGCTAGTGGSDAGLVLMPLAAWLRRRALLRRRGPRSPARDAT